MTLSKNSKPCAAEIRDSMIETACIVGHQRGMEAVVSRTVAVSKVVKCCATLRDLFDFAETSLDLILVLQHWPDEYPRSGIEKLLGEFPVSRILCCYGAWCASMGRTRAIWPPACLVPCDEYDIRLAQEIAVLAGDRTALPVTAGFDELFEFLHGG